MELLVLMSLTILQVIKMIVLPCGAWLFVRLVFWLLPLAPRSPRLPIRSPHTLPTRPLRSHPLHFSALIRPATGDQPRHRPASGQTEQRPQQPELGECAAQKPDQSGYLIAGLWRSERCPLRRARRAHRIHSRGRKNQGGTLHHTHHLRVCWKHYASLAVCSHILGDVVITQMSEAGISVARMTNIKN